MSVCTCVCVAGHYYSRVFTRCQEGDAGFKTMGDNDFNFMCNAGLTMQEAPLKRGVIFI